MIPLLLLLASTAHGRPQIFAHPAAGEADTQAATVQVPAPTVTVGRRPAVTTTSFDDGLYRPATTTLRNAKTAATTDDDDDADVVPTTTSVRTRAARPTTTAVTSVSTSSSSTIMNAIIATTPLTTSSVSSLVLPSLTSSSSVSPSASAASANDSADSTSTGPSTSSVVIPLVVIGVVILLALIGGILWSRKKKIKAWWSGQSGETEDWDEKRDVYRDGDFDPYTGRSGGNWPLGGEDFGAGDDRYGPVSSRIRQSTSPSSYTPYEETGTERGWLWGTRQVSDTMQKDRDVLAGQNQYDAMLAQSRTGYLPSEAAARLNRQPSYFARAGAAIVSSLSVGRRNRRIAKLSGESAPRPGTWDEHGSWRPLQDEDEAPKRLPATPPSRLNMSAFSGINQDSVARPLMAAAPDSISRSEKRWQLADGPVQTHSPSPSPTKAGRVVPASLQTRQAGYSSPVSPRGAPELFYSAASPSPTRMSHQQQLSASHNGLPNLAFSPSRNAGPPVPAKADVFDSYTALPARRSPSPTKGQRGLEVDKRPASSMSQRSGSLTELVSRLLDEDEL